MNNTKKRFSIFVFIAIIVVIFFGIFYYAFCFNVNNYWDNVLATITLSGNGTEENPYIIASADDLFMLADGIDTAENNPYNNKYYKQTQDIDFTNQTFNGIGGILSTPITINYDGLGHSITQIQNGSSSHFSLFGKIQNSYIKNLNIKNVTINESITETNVSKNIGLFVDYALNSKITNCSLETTTLNLQASNLTNVNIGGFVGFAKNSILIDCYCSCINLNNQLSCDNLNLGLFVGKAEDSKISTCFADGTLVQNGSIQNTNIGGFVGESNSEITNCYSIVSNGFEIADINLLQSANIGGFAGRIESASNIESCYAVTTFTNQDYSMKNVGFIAGLLLDNSAGFTNCYLIDRQNLFLDKFGITIYDASNLLTRDSMLNQNYYALSSYSGFNNLIWKDNYNISHYPSLYGVANEISENFEAKLTDEFGRTKGYYDNIEGCAEYVESNDFIYILKEQISISSIELQNNVTITSDNVVQVEIETSNANCVFILKSGATLCIDGEILFEGLPNNNIGFASGQGAETLILKHVSIFSFGCETLVDNLSIEIYNSIIQNNTTQKIFNAQNAFIKKSILVQNSNTSNSKSILEIENQIEIYGYDNLLDICLAFEIDTLNAKIIRTGLTDAQTQKTSTLDIVIKSEENYWLNNVVLVQANQNLIYDNIDYTLNNSPKFTQTNVDKYILKTQGNQLVLRGQLFDIEYFDNQFGEYQRFYGKDEFNDDLPQIYEYGENISINSLQNNNLEFVGWFGYNFTTNRYFDKNSSSYASLYDSHLSSANSINSISTSFASQICFYNLPNQVDEITTYGKIVLYSKWQCTFSVEMQEEAKVGGELEYTASFDAGVLSIDDSAYTTNISNIASKQIYVGAGIKLTAMANANYTFIGWWQQIGGEFVKYNLNKYEYDAQLNIYVLNISSTNGLINKLYARYIKNAYVINLQEVFKNEYNIQNPMQILSSAEQILYASIKRDGVDYVGIQYLDIIDNELVLRKDDIVALKINPKNYHLDSVQGKGIQIDAIQNNSFPKYEFDNLTYTLTLENNVGSGYGSLTIYLEKNYHKITLKYGTNQNKNSFDGGDCEISETYFDGTNTLYNTFNHVTKQVVTEGELKTLYKTAYIYFGTSAIIYLNTQNEFRFDISNTSVQDEDGQRVDFSLVKENEIPKAIVINGVTKNIEVLIHFKKTYAVHFSLSEVSIDGTSTKIGELQIESDDWTTEDKIKIVDKGSSIDFKTKQTNNFGPYQFVKWIITSEGKPVDLNEIGLTENSLKQKELIVYNVNKNLEITAFYNKSNVKVNVIWNGKNGKVANIGANSLGNDSYEIEYNSDILFVITPKTKKYFIKRLECEDHNLQFEEIKNEEGSINYVLKNVLANTKVYLDIVADSWLEHLEQNEFYGDGTKESPYIISTPSELQLIAKFVNGKVQATDGKTNYNVAYYKLANDIDLGEDYYFVPIGTASSPFNGTFDYNFYEIKNVSTEPEAYIINDTLLYIMGKDGKIINKYHSNKPIIISIISIGATVLIAAIIVIIIEKKRKRPKRVIILNSDITKNVE